MTITSLLSLTAHAYGGDKSSATWYLLSILVSMFARLIRPVPAPFFPRRISRQEARRNAYSTSRYHSDQQGIQFSKYSEAAEQPPFTDCTENDLQASSRNIKRPLTIRTRDGRRATCLQLAVFLFHSGYSLFQSIRYRLPGSP